MVIDDLLAVASAENLEGMVVLMPENLAPNPNALLEQFKQAYIAEYGDFPPMRIPFITSIMEFKAAAEKANSLDPDAMAAAMEGLEFEAFDGINILIKRQDLGIERACELITAAHYAVIQDGELIWVVSYSAQEVYEAANAAIGITK